MTAGCSRLLPSRDRQGAGSQRNGKARRPPDGAPTGRESATISPMPCLVVIVVLAFPRVALVALWLLTNYLQRAYHGLLIPLLGFFFLPLTTLAYAWMVNTHRPMEGVNLIILIVAVIIDLGGLGGGEYHRRGRD